MNEKPYYSLDSYLKETYGQKIYKAALNAGLSCPNRDGTLDTRGCIFCSRGGSGDFSVPVSSPEDFGAGFEAARQKLAAKYGGSRFIAYFQAYTNTYGPVPYLEAVYRRALSDADVAGISIATRPDCLPQDILRLLGELREQYPDKFIWIELGLQTIRRETADLIRRGYGLDCFEKALSLLDALSIPVVVHLILGLPGESPQDTLDAVDYLNALPVWDVKLQLLHVLRGTDLEKMYREDPRRTCPLSDKEAYLDLLIRAIERLRPDMVIHRVTGDAPKALLVAPSWSANKRGVLNSFHREMKRRQAFQGRLYQPPQWQGRRPQ